MRPAVPRLDAEAPKLEARGIEPLSQDNPSSSLYMLSLVFCCRNARRSPTTFARLQPSLSRLSTNGRIEKPACYFAAVASQATRRAEACLLLGSHTIRGGSADSACNIVVGS